jgi:hypothetical protein
MKETMSTIITDYLAPGTGNIGLILDHNIDDSPLFRSDANSQAVIAVNADGLYEFFTFQALLFGGQRKFGGQVLKFSVLRGACGSGAS